MYLRLCLLPPVSVTSSNSKPVHIMNKTSICSFVKLLSPGRVLVVLFHYPIVFLVYNSGLFIGYDQRCFSYCVCANIHDCLGLNNIQFDQFIRDDCVCRGVDKKVIVSASAGTLKITTTAGLTAPTGYTTAEWAGAGELAFLRSLSDVNNSACNTQLVLEQTITVTATAPTIILLFCDWEFLRISTVNKNFFDAKADAETRTVTIGRDTSLRGTSARFDYIKAKAGLSSRIWLGASDAS